MSLWSRIANTLRGDHLNRELDEEFQSHIEEAIAEGRDPAEVRRAFGSTLRQRETSRNIRLIPWLDSLRADIIFGCRQLKRNKITSATAILSLALATGACTSAFRLIDALLLRPLPVANANHLYELARQGTGFDGKPNTFDGWAYPDFQLMRAAAKNQAELIAVSYAQRMDLTYSSDQETEKAYIQYVSGWMFDSFGLHPALGRLFTEDDDRKPNANPYVVISNDYWTHRFGRDPKIIGRTLRMGDTLYEIIGVSEQPFTGTEPGTITDIFLPTMMHPQVTRSDATWHRTLALVKPGIPTEPLRQQLNATSQAFERERAKGFTGIKKELIDRFVDQTLVLEPAATGASNLQRDYRRALGAIGVLVALVLLIACANVANLMTALAAARSREMALRVSIGAGRWRLVQMVLVESALLAFFAAIIGAFFAWWSAPFVVSLINPSDNPAHLILPADWRVAIFGLALIFCVMLLFGLLPALRASAVKPVSALKGGEDPHSRRRLMHSMIAIQVAFCFLVVFVAGLFVATFNRLSNRPMGFSTDRLLLLETVTRHEQPPVFWDQVADDLRSVPGVEAVAISGWPLLGGSSWNGFISINGVITSPDLAYSLTVSPGWTSTMKIPFLDGRDFRATDTSPGVAIVNETFAKTYFNGENPVGKFFNKGDSRYEIVALVRDAPYRSLREPILPTSYVPFHRVDAKGAPMLITSATFLVRTSSANPLALAPVLRQEVPRARPDFRVSNIRTQAELVRAQTVRERLLAMLGLFFAAVALLLSGIGLYGVLNYSVLQRQREIGIRMAIGAQRTVIARLVTTSVFSMVLIGAITGLTVGMASVRYIETLFYQVKATDPAMLILPSLAIIIAALLAALPPVIYALKTNPVIILRAE